MYVGNEVALMLRNLLGQMAKERKDVSPMIFVIMRLHFISGMSHAVVIRQYLID